MKADGGENGMIFSFESTYDLFKTIIDELLPEVCPNLSGKPKLVFVQAGQGRKLDDGFTVIPPQNDNDGAGVAPNETTGEDDSKIKSHAENTESKDEIIPYCIPNFSDLLIMYATYDGHHAWRNDVSGSWFIQALCQEIKKSQPEEDLSSILIDVSFSIAINKASETFQKKQVPLKQDTLLRKIYLKSSAPDAGQSSTNNDGDGTLPDILRGPDVVTETTMNDIVTDKPHMPEKKDQPNDVCLSPSDHTTELINDSDAIQFFQSTIKAVPVGVKHQIETYTQRDSPFYNLSKGRKLALIFNHYKFYDKLLTKREGTEADVKAIKQTFERLNFTPIVLNDPTTDEVLRELEGLRNMNDLSCLALFILSHGEENKRDFQLNSKDGTYTLKKQIIPKLLPKVCPSLAGKPKLIFIQACAGGKIDEGVHMHLVPSRTSYNTETFKGSYCIPNYSDFLVFSASSYGYVSMRNTVDGTYFIQALCDEIENAKPEDHLNSILTALTFSTAIKRQNKISKQVPLKQDTLLRKIYLKFNSDPQKSSTNNVPLATN